MQKSGIGKWNTQISKYRNKCKKICKVSKSIRYVGVINSHGRTLAGKINHGIKPLLSALFIVSVKGIAVTAAPCF